MHLYYLSLENKVTMQKLFWRYSLRVAEYLLIHQSFLIELQNVKEEELSKIILSISKP